jgi:hypothetical protein
MKAYLEHVAICSSLRRISRAPKAGSPTSV